jgi:RNA polymerase sigma-70 factor (ECF subfamily)
MGPVGELITQGEFEGLVAGHRRELLAHCYRMLGSIQDAEDALQEALLGAWRGRAGFEGRSSARAWLYRICTNACLRLIARRPRRLLSPDHGPALKQAADLGQPVTGPVWLEPWPGAAPEVEVSDPEADYLRRESVELAFVAALQHLPATQRAVLILREVLEYPAAEVADLLDTTPAAVNSALQRARKALGERVPATSQRAELGGLGDAGRRDLVDAFVGAWERGDVEALTALLAEDARFTMPPLPAWFDGRADVAMFMRERLFQTPWTLRAITVNGQLGFACYQGGQLGAVTALTLRGGRIVEICGFVDPALHSYFAA